MFVLRALSEGGGGPNTELQWLLYVGMAFLFLMFIVGWWNSSRKQDQPEARHEAKKSTRKSANNNHG